MAQGTVWWNELRTSDEQGAAAFYSKLLGWGMFQLSGSDPSQQPDNGDPAYTVWMMGWTQAGGMMRANTSAGSGWLPFIAVSDVDECAAKALALGGEVLELPFDVPNSGRFAVLRDPQGATFGIAKPLNEAP